MASEDCAMDKDNKHKNLVKFSYVVSEICKHTDQQTERQTKTG